MLRDYQDSLKAIQSLLNQFYEPGIDIAQSKKKDIKSLLLAFKQIQKEITPELHSGEPDWDKVNGWLISIMSALNQVAAKVNVANASVWKRVDKELVSIRNLYEPNLKKQLEDMQEQALSNAKAQGDVAVPSRGKIIRAQEWAEATSPSSREKRQSKTEELAKITDKEDLEGNKKQLLGMMDEFRYSGPSYDVIKENERYLLDEAIKKIEKKYAGIRLDRDDQSQAKLMTALSISYNNVYSAKPEELAAKILECIKAIKVGMSDYFKDLEKEKRKPEADLILNYYREQQEPYLKAMEERLRPVVADHKVIQKPGTGVLKPEAPASDQEQDKSSQLKRGYTP